MSAGPGAGARPGAGIAAHAGARLAVDIGGTFTDFFLLTGDGVSFTRKVLSTPSDYSGAVAEGVAGILAEAGLKPGDVREFLHGTTIVTNTCIELTGAKVGLITTRGFRDVLEITRGRMPRLYDLEWRRPVPLAPREMRVEVDERVDRDGRVVTPLDAGEAQRAAAMLVDRGAESIAVCLYNSPHNPVHEERIGEILARSYPRIHVSLSTRVMPLIKEYERTCETVVNAYVMPVVAVYMRRLKERLLAMGVRAPILVMQSNGGMISAEACAERPVEIVECGPAGGVVGAAHVARRLGVTNLITLDLGGTTCKASIVEEGRFSRSSEYEVGAGIHMASRLRKGNGYVLRIPSIDIAEIGAGGGSLITVDSGGLLTVGPRSAGADPGPACYNRGGTDPALTDCYLVLGYLNPDHLLGGAFPLEPRLALQALSAVASKVGMSPVEAAYGAWRIANSNMGRAIHAVSSERGRDPRKFVSLVFGGAGPLHAAAVARNLGMARAVVAPHAGVFSAFGFSCADIERTRIRGAVRPWVPDVLPEVEGLFAELSGDALRTSAEWGFAAAEVVVERSVDLRYRRQASELTVTLPPGALDAAALEGARRAFDAEHEKTFGHSFPDAGTEMVSVRLVSRIARPRPPVTARSVLQARPPGAPCSRSAYFGPETGFVDTPVVEDVLPGGPPLPGPVLIDRYDTTIVVPPGCTVTAAEGGALVIDIGTGGSHA
jgi:N-methylhydantoinase A